ncbi:hypothetical protein ACFTZB_29945 [Rhodococcus sp. NPDC057014]|uniref:hypothetical protein n=1 Tax=Rhodococcus sp. NPDC057014 TaxID=3346000 RepID=UPI003635F2FD
MSSDYVWTPPGLDESELEQFLTIERGIPNAANESIHRWLTRDMYGHEFMDVTVFLRFQTAARQDLGFMNVGLTDVDQVLQVLRGLDQTVRAYLVDFMLSEITPSRLGTRPQRVEELQKILGASGAGWQVGLRKERYGLVEVMPGGVVDIVEEAMSAADQASSLLRAAWERAFGIDQSPSHAYYDAVRAVEVLSCPLISPKDANATLGKDINVLRNAPDKWEFSMKGSKFVSPVEHVVSAMQLLWHSQSDRHGRADYEDVSADEAQAAVLLSSTLVGWLSKSMLRRSEAN